MYEVGTLGVIVERQSQSDGTAKIMVEGRKRARVKRFVFDEEFYKAEVEEVADSERLNLDPFRKGLAELEAAWGLSQPDRTDDRARALFRSVLFALHAYNRRAYAGHKRKTLLTHEIEDAGLLPYTIARHLEIDLAAQQTLLENTNPVQRLEMILGYLQAGS
jgi:ATP-dependent Lon protease